MIMMNPYSYVGCKQFAFAPQNMTEDMKEQSANNIIKRVADYYGIDKKEILGKSRKEDYVLARHITVHLILTMTGMSLIRCGKIFNRDHSTMIHSRQFISNQLSNKYDQRIKEDIKNIKLIL